LAEAAYPVEVDPLIGENIEVSSDANDEQVPVVAANTTNSDDNYRYLVVWELHVVDFLSD
jgi:hypothetical protein